MAPTNITRFRRRGHDRRDGGDGDGDGLGGGAANRTALGSTMHASRQSAQPVQTWGSMTGLVPSSQWSAPGTGQDDAQAPHSGPA